jgi:hypothetical protein
MTERQTRKTYIFEQHYYNYYDLAFLLHFDELMEQIEAIIGTTVY